MGIVRGRGIEPRDSGHTTPPDRIVARLFGRVEYLYHMPRVPSLPRFDSAISIALSRPLATRISPLGKIMNVRALPDDVRATFSRNISAPEYAPTVRQWDNTQLLWIGSVSITWPPYRTL